MANETKPDPVGVGTAPAFPPEVAESSTIGSNAETAVSGGLIGETTTTHSDLSDC